MCSPSFALCSEQMVPHGTDYPNQPLRSKTSQKCLRTLSSANQGHSHKNRDRQCKGHILYKSTMGRQIILPVHGSTKTMEFVHLPQCSHISCLPARSTEYDSRQSQDLARPQLGHEPNSVPLHILSLGNPNNRLVCHLPEQKIPTLLLQSQSQATLLRRLSPSPMGKKALYMPFLHSLC